jgi:hypothetical protein
MRTDLERLISPPHQKLEIHEGLANSVEGAFGYSGFAAQLGGSHGLARLGDQIKDNLTPFKCGNFIAVLGQFLGASQLEFDPILFNGGQQKAILDMRFDSRLLFQQANFVQNAEQSQCI